MSTGRARAMWWMKLHSAFRTALACTIVGCTTLYGPACFTRQITFPAFSYVTAILIVSDANLGDALRGCWHAFYATLQVLPLSMLGLQIIGPARISASIAALAVVLNSLLVALPDSTHLMSKRIAFGQIVIVYVDAAIHGKSYSSAPVHIVHVASSTALGAISAFLALLLPFPRLANYELRKFCRLYAENATERMNLYLNATIAENHLTAVELISQAKPLAATGNKLLHVITLIQEGILWEMPWLRFSKPHFVSPADRLKGMETSLRGMEVALDFCPHLPAGLASQDLTDIIMDLSAQLGLKFEQARCFLPFNATTVPEPLEKLILPNYKTILSNSNNMSAFFFLTCMEQFLHDSIMKQNPEPYLESHKPEMTKPQRNHFKVMCGRWLSILKNERVLSASKCSLSLGLAVLVGLTFNKENGYWSGLTIAISFATGRQAIFTVANARAQGTAIGSVYGVLGSFIFKNFTEIRFVALLPWIFFTSFLRHSRMYGQAGGISAVIGALLILGRNNYGPADEFAIARLVEAVIGLCCFVLIELLLQPTRASTLAKRHLYLSLGTLQECMTKVVFYSGEKDQPSMNLEAFKETIKHLKSHVHDFENFIEQAELEPSLWFIPFRGSCYWKLQESLSNMANLLHCMAYSLESLLQVLENHFAPCQELQEHINDDLEYCKDTLYSSIRCLEKANIMKTLEVAQELQEGKKFQDLEKGNFPTQKMPSALTIMDKQIEKIESYFMQQSKKGESDIMDSEGEEELRGKMVLAFCSLGFCTSFFMREVKETESVIKELIQWEIHSSYL